MTDGRIWVDVTDFLKWSGAFTAFQHIQYNMARYLIDKGHAVSFFVYDESSRSFREIDFDPSDYAQNGQRVVDAAGMTTVSVARRLLAAAKRRTPHKAKKLIKAAVHYRRQTVQTVGGQVAAPFQRNDRVVVLGGIWHGSFAADMAAQKKKIGFQFYHVVHDMVPVVVPQYVVEDLPGVFAAYKKIIFSIADGLMANSESSKRDALAFMKREGITPPPFTVFRLADAPDPALPQPVKAFSKEPFILSLGTVEGRKNHALLYYAYKEAARLGIELPRLAIAGRIGWLINDIKYIIEHDPDVKDKIIFLGGVSNGERAWLLEHCQYTVWPSFYEGWGMPIAESLAYGKMCISSNTASMPEAGLDFCVYLSPTDLNAWVDAMVTYSQASQRAKLEAHIKSDYKPTTWEQMSNTLVRFITQ